MVVELVSLHICLPVIILALLHAHLSVSPEVCDRSDQALSLSPHLAGY
jgi:hypothetical protein